MARPAGVNHSRDLVPTFLAETDERPACADRDPHIFFPGSGQHGNLEAKRICAACPIETECRDWALNRGNLWGVWGGLSKPERDALRAGRRTRSQLPARRSSVLARFRPRGLRLPPPIDLPPT